MTLDRLNDPTMTFPSHGDRRAYAAEQKLATLRAALASLAQDLRRQGAHWWNSEPAPDIDHRAPGTIAEHVADQIAALLKETP